MSRRALSMTRAELAALNVKRVIAHRPKTLGPKSLLPLATKERAAPIAKEHNIQVAYFVWVAEELERLYPGISDDIYAIPNGVRVSRRQAGKLKREGLRAGRPDISIDRAHGGYFGMRLEAKAEHSPSTAQKRIMARLASMNYYAPHARGLAKLQRLTLEYLAKPATKVAR